jgi:two-component system sensor histidine kinase DesK
MSMPGAMRRKLSSGTAVSGLATDLRGSQLLAPRLAAAVMTVVLLGFLLVQSLNILDAHHDSARLAVAATLILALLVLQALHSVRPVRLRPPRLIWVTLVLQALLTFLPLVWFGLPEWGGMPSLLIASALLLLPAPMSWAVPVLITAALGVGSLSAGYGYADTAYLLLLNVLTGLGLYALVWLAEVVTRLHGTHADLARLAVADERLRFSRDLHDLLGYSLTAITLKGELAHRLVDTDVDQARDNADTVVRISRQALADVRAVTRSYRDLSLAVEVASAQSVLEAAGIAAVTEANVGPLSRELDTVLATIVREAVTNLLRHSSATQCHITASVGGGEVRLVMENDGVLDCPDLYPPGRGGGLDNLRTRMAAVRGRLAVTCADGRFRLEAVAPRARLSRTP